MSLLLDSLVIVVVAVSIFLGIKRGFIRSVMGIVVLVAAILGSIYFSPTLGAYLNENYVEDAVSGHVRKSLDSLVSGVESLDIDDLFRDKPKAFEDVLNRFGVDFDDLKNFYEEKAAESGDAVGRVAEHIASPIASAISKGAAFAILFIGIYLGLSIVLLIVDLIFKIPMLEGANRLLGAIFGAALGLAIAWGISTALCSLLPQLSMISDHAISPNIIEDTIVVRFLGAIDILSLF